MKSRSLLRSNNTKSLRQESGWLLPRKDESLVGLKSEQREEWPEMKGATWTGTRKLWSKEFVISPKRSH